MIEVEVEGTIFEFPDETEQSVIGNAVRKYFKQPRPIPEIKPQVKPVEEPELDIAGRPIPELRQGKLPTPKEGLEKIPGVREGANQLKIAAQSLNEGIAGFSDQLDLIAGYISTITGMEQGDAFKEASKLYEENAEYWESILMFPKVEVMQDGEFNPRYTLQLISS